MPTVALASLIALVIAIALSSLSHVNVGVLALSLAWIIGYYLADMPISAIIAGFPVGLVTILFGVTFLFAQAQHNGTLDSIAVRMIRLTGQRRGLIPLFFFGLALLLASIGPGNVAAVALVAPLAMSIAGKAGISAFLMTLMIANGANAGAFSPFSPTGIIANGLIERLGITMNPWTQVYLPSLIAQSVIAMAGYLAFGGLGLWRVRPVQGAAPAPLTLPEPAPLTRPQLMTTAAIVTLIVGVIGFKADIGFLAITLAALLSLLGVANQESAMKAVPWNIIMMVAGVSVLVAILEKTGGMDLFTTLLAGLATPQNITGLLALISGILSVYSSSSGVVMPTLILSVPGLISKLGAGDPVALISAINVGSHVVDVSPLSTLGAMCIAEAGAHESRDRLFQRLLLYGLAMAIVGALVSYLCFSVLW